MDGQAPRLDCISMDNVGMDTPHLEDSGEDDSPPFQVPTHHDPEQQPPQGTHHAPEQTSSSQRLSSGNDATDCFESMLEELRSEPPPFNPATSGDEVSDWLINAANEDFLSSVNAAGQEAQEDVSDSLEQLVASEMVPERGQAELTQPSGTTSKAGASTDTEEAMKLLEPTSNVPQNASDEAPLVFGSLQIPIVDQYPCFQVSSDGDRIEVDNSVFKAFPDDKDDTMDCNIVTVGTFLELEHLPKLKQENLPKPAPEHIIENPLSASCLFKRFSDMLSKQNQEQGRILKKGAVVGEMVSNDLACTALEPKLSGKTSCQGALNVENTLKSYVAENHVTPMTTAPPPVPANIQLGVMGHENSVHENPLTKWQDGILNPGGLSRSRLEDLRNEPFNLQLNPPFSAGEMPHHLVHSLNDAIPGKQSSSFQVLNNRNTSSTHCGSEVHAQGTLQGLEPHLLRKRSHVSTNHGQFSGVGNFSSSQAQASMNLSVPIPPHVNPNVVLKGHPHVTPTSIMSPQMRFQFQNKPRQVSNLEFSNRAKNNPFDVQQMSVKANLAWGRRTTDDKRRICEVGSSYQTPTKKSRTVSSIPKVRQDNDKRTDETSHLSRFAMQKIAYQSPNLSSSTHPITAASKSTARTHGLTQHFIPGMQLSPMERPAQSTQGQESEATVSSPSKPRSTNVREERGQLLKRFVCSDCPAAYAFKENCERHFKVIHQGRTVYFCHHCPASYLQSKTMRCHVDKKHHVMDGENSIFPCYWCGFKTNTEMSWSMHVSEMHPGHKNSFRGNSG